MGVRSRFNSQLELLRDRKLSILVLEDGLGLR